MSVTTRIKSKKNIVTAIAVFCWMVAFQAASFADNRLLFILFFSFTVIAVVLLSVLALFFVFEGLIWLMVPDQSREDIYGEKRRFHLLAALLFCVGWFVYIFCFGYAFAGASFFAGAVAAAVFVVYLITSVLYIIRPARYKAVAGIILAASLLSWSCFRIAKVNNSDPEYDAEARLRSLPYADWISDEPNIHKVGVTVYVPSAAFKGFNIYNAHNSPEAFIIDMKGNIVHGWQANIFKDDTWHHVELCENGDLLTIRKDRYLLKLDWDSEVKWILNDRFHHDISVAGDGSIYSIVRQNILAFKGIFPAPIEDDYI
ncbi:hypothetical protein ACFLTD_03640, partial [Elusimicrobiota bacterium]